MADSGSLDNNNWLVSIMFMLYTIGYYCLGPVIGGLLVDVSFRWVFGIKQVLSSRVMLCSSLT